MAHRLTHAEQASLTSCLSTPAHFLVIYQPHNCGILYAYRPETSPALLRFHGSQVFRCGCPLSTARRPLSCRPYRCGRGNNLCFSGHVKSLSFKQRHMRRRLANSHRGRNTDGNMFGCMNHGPKKDSGHIHRPGKLVLKKITILNDLKWLQLTFISRSPSHLSLSINNAIFFFLFLL